MKISRASKAARARAYKSTYLLAPALVLALIASCGSKQPDEATETVSQPVKVSDFDGNRAFDELKKIVEFGARPAGSEALKKSRTYIESELKSYGLQVVDDAFDGDTPHGKIAMVNIIAELPGQKPDVVLITGHYDTAPFPGFVGANDGGSSTAAVLETARVLSHTKPEYTLWFVFFDGEEAVVDWNANNGMDNTYGSRHLLQKLTASGEINKVRAMILYDMIGDKKLDLIKDGNSTPWLVDLIWKQARKANYGRYFLGNETEMEDDHIPWKNAGIPVVDLIDFDYGPDNSYWHTTQDTVDKVSGESLKIVGDVVIAALPEIFKRLDSGKSGNGNLPQ
jgi:Zn-dependent M28 family amino/carboxypeptidase